MTLEKYTRLSFVKNLHSKCTKNLQQMESKAFNNKNRLTGIQNIALFDRLYLDKLRITQWPVEHSKLTAWIYNPVHPHRSRLDSSCRALGARGDVGTRARVDRTLDHTRDSPASCSQGLCVGMDIPYCGRHL